MTSSAWFTVLCGGRGGVPQTRGKFLLFKPMFEIQLLPPKYFSRLQYLQSLEGLNGNRSLSKCW